ncbi:MAG: hypothetical protein LBK57_04975 [Clostridiales Family XIII bacterium]|jgi:epoxyqueuosine reductase QueG|nr:hypothetical protein [Clostridiales Family XIII bacterium]
MSELKNRIKSLSKSLGIDMIGFAGTNRFCNAPDGRHPRDVLPGCKTVIVFGIRLLDGVTQANFRAFEDGRNDLKSIYATYGYTMVPNFEAAYACYAIARFIENNSSGIATPCSTGPMTNGFQISIRHAAVAAGLGEFGYLGIVITPEFGPRIRFGAILTTSEIEADPMYAGPRLCKPKQCGICAKVCPTGAVGMPGEKEMRRVEIDGKEYEYSAVNFPKCRKALQAMTKSLGGKEDYLTESDPGAEDILEAERRMPTDGKGLQHIPTWNCGRCQTYCPVGNWGEKFKKTGLSKGAATVFINEKL